MHFSATCRMKHKGESQLFVSVLAASKLSPPSSVPKSAISLISAKSSISSTEDIEEIEDFDSEQRPTFSELVVDLLPSLLSQSVPPPNHFIQPTQRPRICRTRLAPPFCRPLRYAATNPHAHSRCRKRPFQSFHFLFHECPFGLERRFCQ